MVNEKEVEEVTPSEEYVLIGQARKGDFVKMSDDESWMCIATDPAIHNTSSVTGIEWQYHLEGQQELYSFYAMDTVEVVRRLNPGA